MEIKTHTRIDRGLCGRPKGLGPGTSQVELVTTSEMKVDDQGLVHGGFIFGLADHAAMIAVNHPHVVLAAAQVKFLKPVKAGETVLARAQVRETDGRKNVVAVRVSRDEDTVFEGTFTCFVLPAHVLDT